MRAPSLLFALCAVAVPALAAESGGHGNMDHAGMDHGALPPKAPAAASQPSTDHNGMDHGSMNHGEMNHGAMDHAEMNHGAMNHGSTAPSTMNQGSMKQPAMDHGKMDHGAMNHGSTAPGTMDHGSMKQPAMDHSGMSQGQAGPAHDDDLSVPGMLPPSTLPVLTDADREAAFPALQGHTVHDKYLSWMLVADQLEYQDADAGSTLSWDVEGWIGGDIDRFWLRSEGERTAGETDEAELQLLWGHAIDPWWDVVAGVRQDFKPGSPQTWGAFGVQGMALYGLESEATAFIGEGGQTAARLEADYDILLTNRLILQPTVEVNFYGKDDPARGIGSGLSDTEVGLRLRYEIVRQFAPYVGVSWGKSYGDTADFARTENEDDDEVRLVAGVRIWF